MGNLYHYTSMQGFESIIKNQTIRMTRSDFMNDPNDCCAFFNIVEKHIEKISYEKLSEGLNLSNKSTKVLEIVKKYPPMDYLRFLVENIPIYVLSLTIEQDSLSMWNYYGKDGIQIIFGANNLLQIISEELVKKEYDYIISTKVDYIDLNAEIKNIKVHSFNDFKVLNYSVSDNKPIDYQHNIKHFTNENLEFFIESFVTSYINTVAYSLSKANNKIEFFKEVFERNRNIINTKADLKFKADIDLYMLILATHLKSDAFKYENETRIAYFNYDLENDNLKEENYSLSNYYFGTVMKPNIECKSDSFKKNFFNMINGVTLSPFTRKIPFDIDKYKRIICDFINKNGGNLKKESIKLSNLNIRW